MRHTPTCLFRNVRTRYDGFALNVVHSRSIPGTLGSTEQAGYMTIARYFAHRDFLYCRVDGVEPPLCLVRSSHMALATLNTMSRAGRRSKTEQTALR